MPHLTCSFHLRDFGGRDFVLALDTPAGYQDYGGGGEEAEDRQPPGICQISEKPITTAKKAVMKPAALLRGTSIAS